jgi:hypothetical protein
MRTMHRYIDDVELRWVSIFSLTMWHRQVANTVQLQSFVSRWDRVTAQSRHRPSIGPHRKMDNMYDWIRSWTMRSVTTVKMHRSCSIWCGKRKHSSTVLKEDTNTGTAHWNHLSHDWLNHTSLWNQENKERWNCIMEESIGRLLQLADNYLYSRNNLTETARL